MKPYYADEYVTIYHGDCREIAPTLVGELALISDPPYGMKYDTNGARFTRGGRSLPAVRGDDMPFDPSPWIEYRWCVLWGFNHFPTRLTSGGALVWVKRTESAFGAFLSDAEIAWTNNGCGVYAFRNTAHAISCERQHPSQKPVNLMVWSIERSGSPPDSVILDPFMGSGTTLIAAKQLNRRAIGIEIEEKYCELAVKRLAQEVLSLN